MTNNVSKKIKFMCAWKGRVENGKKIKKKKKSENEESDPFCPATPNRNSSIQRSRPLSANVVNIKCSECTRPST
jgi:hypothetical protein